MQIDPDLGFDLSQALTMLEHAGVIQAHPPSPASSSRRRNSRLESDEEDTDGKDRSPRADDEVSQEQGHRAFTEACLRLAVEDVFQTAALPSEARAGDMSPQSQNLSRVQAARDHCLRGPLRKLAGGQLVIRGARLLASAIRRFQELQDDASVDALSTVLHMNMNWTKSFSGVSRSHGGAYDLPGYDPTTGVLQVRPSLKMWRNSLPRTASMSSLTDTVGDAEADGPASPSLMTADSMTVGESVPAPEGCGTVPCFETNLRFLDEASEALAHHELSNSAPDLRAPGKTAMAIPPLHLREHSFEVMDILTPKPSPAGVSARQSGREFGKLRPPPPQVFTRADTAYKRKGLSAQALAAFLEFFGLDLGRVPGGRERAIEVLHEEVLNCEEVETQAGHSSALVGKRSIEVSPGVYEWRVCGSRGVRDTLRRFNLRADILMDSHRQTTAEMARSLPLPQTDREASVEEAHVAEQFLLKAEGKLPPTADKVPPSAEPEEKEHSPLPSLPPGVALGDLASSEAPASTEQVQLESEEHDSQPDDSIDAVLHASVPHWEGDMSHTAMELEAALQAAQTRAVQAEAIARRERAQASKELAAAQAEADHRARELELIRSHNEELRSRLDDMERRLAAPKSCCSVM
jgi:hypothetical protein